jgi:glucose-1-phosphate cytidylyltransferase
MRWYAHFGYNEFIIALGYKGEQIKQYFLNYYALNSDITVELRSGNVTVHDNAADDWVVHLVDTGAETMTGGRVRRLRRWLTDDTFMLTYGDGLSNVDLTALVAFHHQHGGLATVTAVRPPARFGEPGVCRRSRHPLYRETSDSGEGWINGGFFVLNRAVLDYIGGDQTMWEVEPLHQLAKQGDLMAYRHTGYWQPMDTLRENNSFRNFGKAGVHPGRSRSTPAHTFGSDHRSQEALQTPTW